LYGELYTGWAPWDFRPLGIGLAYITKGLTTTQRIFNSDGSPFYLFAPDEPGFTEGVMVGNTVYLYADTASNVICSANTLIARAELDQVHLRSAWTFYTGKDWSSDIKAAQSIGDYADGLGSVIYSTHFNGYLAFSLGICSGGNAIFSIAKDPWGPWTTEEKVKILDAESGSYAGEIHRALAINNQMIVSYLRPNQTNGFDSEIQLVLLTFN